MSAPYYDMCEACGGAVEVTSFCDGDQFDCIDCGSVSMWSAIDEDEAFLVLIEDLTEDDQ